MLIRVSTPAHCVVCDGPGWLRDVDHRGIAFAAVCDGCVPPAARPPMPQSQPAPSTRVRDYLIAAVALFVCAILLGANGGGIIAVVVGVASLTFTAVGWDAWRRNRNPSIR